MRKLVLLVLLLGVAGGGDWYAKSEAERRIEHRIDAEVPGDQQSDVDIDSFPFLGRLFASGDAGDLTASMDLIRIEGFRFTNVRAEMKGVEVDRDLLTRKQVAVTGFDSGVITADLTTDVISESLGVPVRIRAGTVEATIAGQTVRAQVSVRANVLQLTVAPLPPVSFTIPTSPLVPCASDATVVDDRIRVTCTLDSVPPALLKARNDPVPAG